MNGNKGFKIARVRGAEDLPLPRRMSEGAAGMDLCANVAEDVVLRRMDIKLIPTGIRIAMPRGYEAQARPRSGPALKHGIGMVNAPGTIDSDYRGELKVILINFGAEDFVIHRGDRVAQLVINKIEDVDFELAEFLDDTERGEGGFGHTGGADGIG